MKFLILLALVQADDRLTIHRETIGEDFTSKTVRAVPFNEAVISWNAKVPKKGSLTVELRARSGGEWLPWAVMGKSEGGELSSVPYRGGGIKVDIDTLVLLKGKADAYQYRLTMTGGTKVSLVAVAHYVRGERKDSRCSHKAWGKVLEVPERSQRTEDPKIAWDICSPTSVAMVLEYHGIRRKTADVAKAVLDHQTKIYGNWVCNTAAAFDAGAAEAYVKQFASLCEAEKEILEGRPVVVSHRWDKGDIADAPLKYSAGHLIVLVGFTKEGDVVVNDPVAHPGKGQKVRRVYKRVEIEKTWFEKSRGCGYVIVPAKGRRR